MNQLSLLFALVIAMTSQAHAFTQGHLFHQQSLNLKKNLKVSSTLGASFFNQRLNHADPQDQRTFKQRFFVDSQYAQGEESPVFYIICGEWNCAGTTSYGYAVNLAKRYKAHLVALEHRYYGESIPFKTLTKETLKYLNFDFALQDLARFQKFMMEQKKLTGKWVAFGGSYAGTLSAQYRRSFPELVAGALASSAPVYFKNEFFEYDAHVAKVINKTQCGDKVREAVSLIEDKLSTPEGAAEVKALFKSSDILLDSDFIYVVADMLAAAVQYGQDKVFCETLITSTDLIKGYAKAGLIVLTALGARPVDISMQAAQKEEAGAEDYFRQWMWQSCTEFGWFQVANGSGENTSRSSQVDLKYHADVCQRLFGQELSANATDEYNHDYYLPLFHADTNRIIFTNGSHDPWLTLSVFEGGPFSNPALALYMMEGAAHCNDLKASSSNPAVTLAQSQMSVLIEGWLNQ